MKRSLCAFLSILMILSALSFTACGKEETLKFGLGVFTDVSKASNAEADKDGEGTVAVTGAAVSFDKDGKIVACTLDTLQATVKYTAEGKATANSEFKTKYEQGDAYNMVAYGKAAKEWYAQADAFETVVIGKTVAEVKALVAEGDKGTDAVISAGCTIMIDEFVGAIESASANAVDSNVTKAHSLKLGIAVDQTVADATEEKDGSNQVETTLFACAVDAEGKIVAADTDCVQVKFTFDSKGASTYDLTKKAQSKREQGDAYNMVAYGKAGKEWYAQADAFESLCSGKTPAEVAGFIAEDGKGTADVKAAGCTIYVTGFTKAAAKVG